MTKRMLIDAAHPEETRVVVMDNSRVEEFDLEAANRLPLKGNIYLARVVRVEPSLQAAFVEYGGNRHGFLAFGEIHPDYYQIPVADRQKLLEMQEAEAREEAEAEAREDERRAQAAEARAARKAAAEAILAETAPTEAEAPGEAEAPLPEAEPQPIEALAAELESEAQARAEAEEGEEPRGRVELLPPEDDAPLPEVIGEDSQGDSDEAPEETGGDDDRGARRRESPRFLRNYKIQEVIKRRQIMLVQVVKEERGNKGAALTTYISLAGRFSVLMPNSPRGGGVSRKITSSSDRRRLREVIEELEMPRGMSLIVRTAGAQRPKAEIRRDCEYLLSLWDNIRERTMASTAPALIYEEADLIKRAIRDGHARDMDEILVEGDEACQQAREFMRMLMPEHLRKLNPYRDGTVPLFSRYGVEQQLDAMHEPTVQLKSGGYIVINQTEALVAIDVNSGRATRERHIEDTAFKTNLEAADEIARQLRLRDLAGLIVIDFIDMDRSRDNAAVEKRLKDALRHDRARIQVGRISHFGLMEMSRQRLRPSLNETAFVTCPHCLGRGTVRSLESSAIAVLRAVEEECARRRAHEITVHVRPEVTLFLLNRKRERLTEIEARWGVHVVFNADPALQGAETRIERSRLPPAPPREEERPAAIRMDYAETPAEDEAEGEEAPAAEGEGESSEERQARRRRRRRRGGRREDGTPRPEGQEEGTEAAEEQPAAEGDVQPAQPEGQDVAEDSAATNEGEGDKRRRGRRGGGRRRREEEATAPAEAVQAQAEAHRSYSGPTPADPFQGHEDQLIAAMEAAEAAAAEALSPRQPPVVMPEKAASPAPEAPKASEPAPVVAEEPAAPAAEEPAPTPAPAAAPAPEAPAPVAEAPAPAAEEPPPVVVGPAIQPKAVEEVAAAAPRRTGFWRR